MPLYMYNIRMKGALSIFLIFIVSGPHSLFASNSDFSELPNLNSLKEMATALHTYQQMSLKRVDYVRNLMTPGYTQQDVKVTRIYNKKEKSYEVLPKFVYKFWPGVPSETGRPLDFHLNAPHGKGFFVVQLTVDKDAYTRDGRFRIDHAGRLVTLSGNFPVYGDDGKYIFLKNEDITVSRQGVIYNEGNKAGRFKVVVFKHVKDMQSAFKSFGSNMYLLRYEIPVATPNFEDGETHAILQGFVTKSGSFNTADTHIYKNFHKATNSAVTLLLSTYNKSQQYMLAPN
jgi:flagellar basal body rod protein FlgG